MAGIASVLPAADASAMFAMMTIMTITAGIAERLWRESFVIKDWIKEMRNHRKADWNFVHWLIYLCLWFFAIVGAAAGPALFLGGFIEGGLLLQKPGIFLGVSSIVSCAAIKYITKSECHRHDCG